MHGTFLFLIYFSLDVGFELTKEWGLLCLKIWTFRHMWMEKKPCNNYLFLL